MQTTTDGEVGHVDERNGSLTIPLTTAASALAAAALWPGSLEADPVVPSASPHSPPTYIWGSRLWQTLPGKHYSICPTCPPPTPRYIAWCSVVLPVPGSYGLSGAVQGFPCCGKDSWTGGRKIPKPPHSQCLGLMPRLPSSGFAGGAPSKPAPWRAQGRTAHSSVLV